MSRKNKRKSAEISESPEVSETTEQPQTSEASDSIDELTFEPTIELADEPSEPTEPNSTEEIEPIQSEPVNFSTDEEFAYAYTPTDADTPSESKQPKEKRGKIKFPKASFIKWPALDYIIAITPLIVWATMLFGTNVLVIVGIAVGTAVGLELLFSLISRRSILDNITFPIVIGLLTACLMPPTAYLWLPALAVAIVVVIRNIVNVLLGFNIINPFAAMMVILFFAFPEALNVFATDGTLAYTPLYYLQNNVIPEISIIDLALGTHYGLIGEISIFLIAAAFLYLVIRKVIKWHLPVAMLTTAFGYHHLFRPEDINPTMFIQMSLLSGAIVFAAVLIATDFSATPQTTGGRILFGILCGALTMFLRTIPEISEGVFFAILALSLITPALDAPFQKVPFAKEKK